MLRRIAGAFLAAGAVLNAAARAQAKWEVEVGQFILSRKKRVLALASLPIVAALGLGLAFADTIPSQIPILGGSRAYIPALVTPQIFYGSILIGLLAGLITGVIGAGGGYVLTPALMSFGVKGIMAVGTDQFHLFAKALIGTNIHRKLGNVSLPLAVWFMGGSFVGVTIGGMVNRAVYRMSPALSEVLINSIYVFVLGLLGIFCLADWLRGLKRQARGAPASEITTGFARWLQALPLRPRVRFDSAPW